MLLKLFQSIEEKWKRQDYLIKEAYTPISLRDIDVKFLNKMLAERTFKKNGFGMTGSLNGETQSFLLSRKKSSPHRPPLPCFSFTHTATTLTTLLTPDVWGFATPSNSLPCRLCVLHFSSVPTLSSWGQYHILQQVQVDTCPSD